jgi:PadR family transcriptional regulator PadR
MHDWISQFRKGLLELCLLNLLGRGEGYGYRIVQGLKELDGLAVSESTVYPILARLHAGGYLRARVERSPGGPERRYFALTQAGERHLSALNGYWEAVTEAVRRLRRPDQSTDTRPRPRA